MICKHCGKTSNIIYGKGIFCSKACASAYVLKNNPKVKEARDARNKLLHEKSLLSKKEKEEKLKKERERKKKIASQEGDCKFCGKACRNQNSLRNHERLCKKNPNRQSTSFNRTPESEQMRLQNLRIANKNKDFSKSLCICQFCKKEWTTTKTGWRVHELHCYSNPNRKEGSFKGHKRSDEEKRKISEGQKLAHKEGRNSPWIGRRKRSYAEQSWYNIFTEKLGKGSFENNYVVPKENSCYFLDFAWPTKKLYFEVDGETHYTQDGLEHDKLRTAFLEKEGWKLVGRCRWSEYQKLSFEEKEVFVNSIIKQLQVS